jgi:4-hydroxy-tetrahydrodipicolinate reductase
VGVCDVVVMGARGRIGSTLVRLIGADPDFRLAAVVVRPGTEAETSGLGCETATDLADLLPRVPGAVVVDFTTPAASVDIARVCVAAGNPVVVGTTGLAKAQTAALAEAAAAGRVFFAPNMSVGVNVLLSVLPALAQRLGAVYDMEIMEIHHNRKADSPSGTAIKLGQHLAAAAGRDFDAVGACCREGVIGPRPAGEIGVQTLRGGDVVGDHTVFFLGPGERIEITHRAHSRETLARGALRAAAWLPGQAPGRLYGMQDMLG